MGLLGLAPGLAPLILHTAAEHSPEHRAPRGSCCEHVTTAVAVLVAGLICMHVVSADDLWDSYELTWPPHSALDLSVVFFMTLGPLQVSLPVFRVFGRGRGGLGGSKGGVSRVWPWGPHRWACWITTGPQISLSAYAAKRGQCSIW